MLRRFVQNLAVMTVALSFVLGCTQAEPAIDTIKPLDQGVVAAVRANLQTDMELAASSLTVEAKNHELVLKGTVPSEEAKERAERLARSVSRVEVVDNQLEVDPREEQPFP